MELDDYISDVDVDSIGVHLPSGAARDFVVAACRAAGRAVVGLEARPSVVVTADGVIEGGVVRCLKDEVDEALPEATRVIVLRMIGDAALAPTMDAYLDVRMIEGRDVWFDTLLR
jgi:acyl-coenzyme A synthetase/AMP-(fatty) acid ligase